jgi:hypothetical protein
MTSAGRSPDEVFLSHASADRAIALAVATTLRGHGIPVWYSETDIRGAEQWHDEIGRALRRCDWFAVLLSPAAVASTWVKRELLFALNDARLGQRIVPVLIADCDAVRLSWTLDAMQRIDFRGRFEEGCREVLRVWGRGLDSSRLHLPAP